MKWNVIAKRNKKNKLGPHSTVFTPDMLDNNGSSQTTVVKNKCYPMCVVLSCIFSEVQVYVTRIIMVLNSSY